MKQVKIVEHPVIKCPVTGEIRPIELCKKCDAHKSTKTDHVQCIADEF